MRMMKRQIAGLLALALLFCAGCRQPTVDELSDRLVLPAALPGQFMLAATGSAEDLIRQGRVDRHEQIPGVDGDAMDVWIIRSRSAQADSRARGTVVLLHPLLTSKSWFLDLGNELADRGWDVVLPDLRAHGESAGKYVTWGAKEKQDVRMVVDALLAKDAVDGHIYAAGASLGASVAIQYAAIDPRVRGVLAVAPPLSGREITRRFLLMESQSQYDAALAAAQQKADFDVDNASAVVAARELACPLLLVHGFLDVVVPYQHSEQIEAAAAGPKKLITLPLDGHAPEILRNDWMADRIDELQQMAYRTPASQAAR